MKFAAKFMVLGIIGLLSIAGFLTFSPAISYAKCSLDDKLCIMAEIKKTAESIENKSWRDKAYRELAKSYTYEGHENKAIALIDSIETPDTKAMTIRGIGMAAADSKWNSKERYDTLFKNLSSEAEKIEHKPSYAIAYTYIAMAQAFAKDDAGAMATAKSMENDALRHKAFGETAEIQAERGDFNAAMESIKAIDSLAFKNKAYATVATIFTKRGELQHAYDAAQEISNSYKRAQVLQTIINHGNAEEE